MKQQAGKIQKTAASGSQLQTHPGRSSAAAHPILELQRSIGNSATQRLIRSPYIQAKLQVSTPGDPFEQEADRVADTVMRIPQPPAAAGEARQLQAKPLAAGITPLAQRASRQPPEEEEREEAAAVQPAVQRVPLAVREDDDEEKVQRQTDEGDEEEIQTKSLSGPSSGTPVIPPAAATLSSPSIQRMCAECEDEQEVHRKEGPGAAPQVTPPVSANIRALQGGGRPLPPAAREFFELRFGADFSRVRVHTDARAEEAAKSINARAFTVGRDIAFGAAQYAPEASEGKRLLAHELAHTIQQGANTTPPASRSTLTSDPINDPDGSPEGETASDSISPAEEKGGSAADSLPAGAAAKVESKSVGSSLLQRQPTDPQPGAKPPGGSDPGAGGPGAMGLNSWLRILPLGALTPKNVIIQVPGKAPAPAPAGTHGSQGFWEDLIDALKPRPCKFYICETLKACKPPDKDEDIWKWWKWECVDQQVCWCGLHEVPANTSEAALLTLATAPDSQRAAISRSPLTRFYLHTVIGGNAWPLALRILAKAPSASVPSLDEATWYLADHAIKGGAQAVALGIVLESLVSRGVINPSLANWSQVARSDRGEGVTNFNWVEDPVTHERRATAPVKVEIYDPAFADVGWLFSTMMHEYVHVLQVIAGGYDPRQFNKKGEQRPEFVARDEVESYLWEIEHALGTGLIKNTAQMKVVGERLTHHFEALGPLKAQYKVRYDAAQRRVLEALAQRPGMSIDDARRIVQETSQEIAELLKQRPGNEAAIDAKIAAVRARRSQALIEVALVDNPNIQVVSPGEPGTYRVPTEDGEGRVRYLHGGIQVAWHMGAASTSAYTTGEALSAGGKMAVSGTAIQGRIHPFPPDIDFDEHIHVVADTLAEAGEKAAKPIIENIRRISGGPTPGRTDLEFRHLVTFPKKPGKTSKLNLPDVRKADAVAKLGGAIAQLNGGNLTTYWRGILADGRLTEVTRVVFVTANKKDGSPLMGMGGSADLNLAFLEDPGEQAATPLGQFAWDMCCDAVRRAEKNEWLKASKRAYNYFSTIGDLTHMAQLEPLFKRAETNVEQYAVVIDAIKQALVTEDPLWKLKQEPTRILSVEKAQAQVENVAAKVERELPDSGVAPSPAAIAKNLRDLAGELRPREADRNIKLDDVLAGKFELQTTAIRVHINTGVKGQVQPIIDNVVRPVCPDKKKCRK